MTLIQRLLILVGTVLTALVGIWLHAAVSLRDVQEQTTRNNVNQLLSLTLSEYSNFVERAQQALAAVSFAAPSAVWRDGGCPAFIDQVRASGMDWLRVDILDPQGIVRCSTASQDLGKDMSSYPEVIAARTSGHAFTGDYTWGLFSGSPGLLMATSWIGSDGTRGVVTALAPLDSLIQTLPTSLLDGYGIVLADRAGRVLATDSHDRNMIGRTLPMSLAGLDRMTASGQNLTTWTDGSERIVAYASATSIRHPGVFIAVGAVGNRAMSGGPHVTYAPVLASLAVAFAAFLLAWWGGVHFIRRPLTELENVALRWRDGDQTARVTMPGRSEISALGRAFNAMADAKDQSDRRLRDSAELLTALIESSQDSIFVTHRDGRLLVANSTFLELIDRAPDAAIGEKLSVPHDPQMDRGLAALNARVMARRMPETCDVFAQVGSNRARRVLQTIGAPIFDTQGEVRAIAGIGRDVTDARTAAKMLRDAKDKAETADRAKTRFLASASHDLRQPLQAAIMLADLVAQKVAGTSQAETAVEDLCRSLSDLVCLVESLFDVSRLDAATVKPELTAFPLGPLLDQIVIAFRPVAERKGIALVVSRTDATVRSDRVLLARMLTNIIENGVRYTHAGRVSIGCKGAGDVLRIIVEDTGIGISQHDLSRIWQEFEQLHNPERDRRQGLGLGLSIVRRLGTLLGHPLEVSSRPGHGSCFVVSVPLAERSVVTADRVLTAAPVTPILRDRLVVAIDDDPMVLDVLRMTLEGYGLNVIAAPDCDTALQQLGAVDEVPDLIIVDYRLRNGCVGTDAIAAICHRVGHWLPAIVLTGELAGAGDDVDRPLENAEKAGTILLRKPVGSKRLLEAIQSAMSAATV